MTDRHGSAVYELPNDLDVLITREFEAPIDLVFDAPAPDARPEATAEGHAPDGMSTFDTAAENRVHSSVSAAS